MSQEEIKKTPAVELSKDIPLPPLFNFDKVKALKLLDDKEAELLKFSGKKNVNPHFTIHNEIIPCRKLVNNGVASKELMDRITAIVSTPEPIKACVDNDKRTEAQKDLPSIPAVGLKPGKN